MYMYYLASFPIASLPLSHPLPFCVQLSLEHLKALGKAMPLRYIKRLLNEYLNI